MSEKTDDISFGELSERLSDTSNVVMGTMASEVVVDAVVRLNWSFEDILHDMVDTFNGELVNIVEQCGFNLDGVIATIQALSHTLELRFPVDSLEVQEFIRKCNATDRYNRRHENKKHPPRTPKHGGRLKKLRRD